MHAFVMGAISILQFQRRTGISESFAHVYCYHCYTRLFRESQVSSAVVTVRVHLKNKRELQNVKTRRNHVRISSAIFANTTTFRIPQRQHFRPSRLLLTESVPDNLYRIWIYNVRTTIVEETASKHMTWLDANHRRASLSSAASTPSL